MATGDAAAAAGLAVFPPTQDLRLGYDNDNKRGDELANHMTNGGHPFSKITGQVQSGQIANGAVTGPKLAKRYATGYTDLVNGGIGSVTFNTGLTGPQMVTLTPLHYDPTGGPSAGSGVIAPYVTAIHPTNGNVTVAAHVVSGVGGAAARRVAWTAVQL